MWQQVKNNTPNDYLFHPFIDSMHVAAGLQLKWRKQYSKNSTILWWPQRFFIWDSYYTKYSIYNVGFARFLLLRCMVNYLNVTCIYSHIPMKIYHKEEFFVFFLITVYHHERMYKPKNIFCQVCMVEIDPMVLVKKMKFWKVDRLAVRHNLQTKVKRKAQEFSAQVILKEDSRD